MFTLTTFIQHGFESPNHSFERRKRKEIKIGVPIVAQWLMTLTRNHGVAGSIPGLAQWANDLVLP